MEMIPHHAYTTVLNKQGWTLIIDFVESDRMTSRPDDWIEEEPLREYHDAVRNIIQTFGLPQKGCYIDTGTDSAEIIDIWFEFPKKVLTLRVL
jgi:hypothetical protein